MKKRCFLSRAAVLTLAALLYDLLVFNCGKVLGVRPPVCLSSAWDDKIPLLPWTSLIYVGAFPFWVVSFYLSFRAERPKADRFLYAYAIGMTVCFCCFVFLPTTMVRPELTGEHPLEWAVQLIYRIDSPLCLLPSIHCFASYLCWRGVRENPNVPKWYRVFSLLFAVAVCVSTLTVKQHVLIDAVTGVALAELSFLLAGAFIRRKKLL